MSYLTSAFLEYRSLEEFVDLYFLSKWILMKYKSTNKLGRPIYTLIYKDGFRWKTKNLAI